VAQICELLESELRKSEESQKTSQQAVDALRRRVQLDEKSNDVIQSKVTTINAEVLKLTEKDDELRVTLESNGAESAVQPNVLVYS